MKRRDFFKTTLAASTALSIAPMLRGNTPAPAPAAVIGGGIVYALFGSYVSVFAYEIILILIAGGFASK